MNVLCIGINNYIIGAKPLHHCKAEANTVFQALRETTRGHHQLLLDPTSASLHEAVQTFSERSRAFPRNLLFFAGHGYEFDGVVYMKSPDSDTASADVCVDGSRANMADGSLFICLLNCCRIHITQAIEGPRMILMKPAPLPSVREFLRRKLRWRRPVRKEHFYLSSTLDGEAAIDDAQFGNHFAEIIRTSPQSSIEKVARQLKSGGSHVEWRSNLEYWHETPIGSIVSFSPKFRVKHLYLFFGLASLSLTTCGMLLTAQASDISTYREVAVAQSHDSTVDHIKLADSFLTNLGLYIDIPPADLSKAEEDLKPRQDVLARLCLAHLFKLQQRKNDSLKLARSICASSTEPLPQAVACEFVCEIPGETDNCFRYQIQAEEIACSVGRVCNRARLRLALTWADIRSGQRAWWDSEMKQTLVSVDKSSVDEDVRLVALTELTDFELAVGEMNLDLIPRTAGPLPVLLQLSFAWKVQVRDRDIANCSAWRTSMRPCLGPTKLCKFLKTIWTAARLSRLWLGGF